jgi:hypothetical protein
VPPTYFWVEKIVVVVRTAIFVQAFETSRFGFAVKGCETICVGAVEGLYPLEHNFSATNRERLPDPSFLSESIS